MARRYAGFDPDEEPLDAPHPGSQKGRDARHATHCKRGHEFTPANTAHVIIAGYKCRRCKTCLAAVTKHKYHTDEAFREAKKAAGRRYWHRKRKHDLAARTSP